MGKTAIIHENLAPFCTTISATNTDPDNTIENILTNCPADKFTTTENLTEIILAFSQAIQFEEISLAAHNLPTNASIQIYLSNDNFQTYDYYESVSIPEIVFCLVSGNHKDIKIIITSTDLIKIGELHIGKYTEISENALYEIIRAPVETSVVIKNDYGQKMKNTKSLLWQIRLKFEYIDTAEFKNIVNIFYLNEAVILVVDTDTLEAYQGTSISPLTGSEVLSGNAFELHFEQNPYEYEPQVF